MGRQIHCIKYNIPSDRAAKCSLECHKALNRAHLYCCTIDVFLLTKRIMFDVYLTLVLDDGRLTSNV
jgi:hypothetical protein